MPFWYFFNVPPLPPDASDQSNQVRIRQYLCVEGDFVEPGTPMTLIENDKALMLLKANGKGIVKKTLFEPHTYVRVGDPVAIIDADGEAIPYGRDYSVLEVVERKRS